MIDSLITALNTAITTARDGGRLSWVQSVRYGAPQAIATTDMPCLLYNLLRVEADAPNEVSVRFGLYACAAITSTIEDASLEAQRLVWMRDDTTPKDRGIIPWLLEMRDKAVVDTAGRRYRLRVHPPYKIMTDQVGSNVRGAVFVEISLTTLLKTIE